MSEPYVDTPKTLTDKSSLVLTAQQSLENVLQNINKLNRSLEGVIAVRTESST